MNQFNCIGTLCYDPEIKTFESGSKKVRLRLAINRTYKKTDGSEGEKTVFADFDAWGTAAQVIADNFQKGDNIIICDASVEMDNWEQDGQKRSKLYFRINSFGRLVYGGQNRERSNKSSKQERSNQPVNRETEDLVPVGGDDSDIPF